MISTRARELTALVERTHEFEQALIEAESFQATTEAVKELGDQLRALSEAYWRVAELIGPTSRKDVRGTFEYVAEQLNQIQLQLSTSPRQSTEIGKLSKQVATAASRLEASWRKWSNEQIKPHRDALELVSFLPEIHQQRATINLALERANQLSQSLPKNDESLRMFSINLETLGTVLGEVEGISATIREFLRKVVSQGATFEDLDSEILSWIRERGRAKAFRIEFQVAQGQSTKWS
jgi:HPt (histidine-containing phosphotransfer) domain-containing protein